MTDIAPLTDRPEHIPMLVSWFEAEWPDYYATQPPGQAESDFRAGEWLLALDGEAPIGVIAFRTFAVSTIAQYSPALGGLYVTPSHRRRGVGATLIQAATGRAKATGVQRLYTSTENAAGIVEQLGWRLVDHVVHEGARLRIFALDLA